MKTFSSLRRRLRPLPEQDKRFRRECRLVQGLIALARPPAQYMPGIAPDIDHDHVALADARVKAYAVTRSEFRS